MIKRNQIIKIINILVSLLVFSLYIFLYREDKYLDLSGTELYYSNSVYEGETFEEVFCADKNTGICMEFLPITWGIIFDKNEYVQFQLKKLNEDKILCTSTINCTNLVDHEYTDKIFFNGFELEKGSWYSLTITSNITNKDHKLALMCTDVENSDSYAIYNGQKQDYDFGVILYD
ncbi:hypothetical protein [Anaerocolumna jejuensis]|uniref:hypothetical protein n=1 Tax=Anaerocolumna jejuensis TaxID=259063 RepID=UPI003F7C59E6